MLNKRPGRCRERENPDSLPFSDEVLKRGVAFAKAMSPTPISAKSHGALLDPAFIAGPALRSR